MKVITRRRQARDDKRLSQTRAIRIATRRDILILIRDERDDKSIYDFSLRTSLETIRFIKRSILSQSMIFDLIARRDQLSNQAYLVSILTSLSDQEILKILIDLRDDKLIYYARIQEDNLQ